MNSDIESILITVTVAVRQCSLALYIALTLAWIANFFLPPPILNGILLFIDHAAEGAR